MSTCAPTAPATPATEARAQASRNFAANLSALAQSQPELVASLRRPPGDPEWLYARDNTLTAIDCDGHWLADCSLPTRAAAAMLKDLDLKGPLACMLAPNHAAQIRRALDLLRPEQGLLVLLPDDATLPLALHCDDFSAEISADRLLFAACRDCLKELVSLFDSRPVLPTPTLFVRPPTTPDDVAQRLIEGSQSVFTRVSARQRSDVQRTFRTTPINKISRVCVAVPSVFRLWDDGGAILADTLERERQVEVHRFDPDRPTTASNLGLAVAARDCDAVVTANFARCDVPPGVVSDLTPWITWCTTRVVPSAARRAPDDRLLLADPSLLRAARESGWPESSISVAAWPAVDVGATSADGYLALVADTRPLRRDITEDTFEFSSHMVLWELIESELTADPFLATQDPDAYLASRAQRLSIASETLPRELFMEQLIRPAAIQSVARLLNNSSLRVFGKGWSTIADLARHSGGEIRSRSDLHHALAGARAIVHPFPPTAVHAFGRPVVPPIGPADRFLRSLASVIAVASAPSPRLTTASVLGPIA